jgi:hypothetical protein
MKHTFSALLAVLAVVLAACGGGSSSTDTGSPATTAAAGDQSAFTKCLADHGVQLPAGGALPGSGGSVPSGSRPAGGPGGSLPIGGPGGSLPAGVDQTKLQEGIQACQSVAPAGGTGFDTTQFQAFATCLKDNGVDASAATAFQQLNSTDPTVQKAVQACQALAPQGGPGALAGSTTAPTSSR